MVIRSIYPCLCVADLEACRDFYLRLLELDVAFDCGWYCTLRSRRDPSHQVALVLAGHPSVPAPHAVAAGTLVSFEVHDVDAVHRRARQLGLEIALELRDERFGQRHFMAVDPAGLLVDVVQPIAPDRSFLREVARWRRSRGPSGDQL